MNEQIYDKINFKLSWIHNTELFTTFFLLTNFDSFVEKNVSKSVVFFSWLWENFKPKNFFFPSFEYKRGHFFKTNYKPKIYSSYDSKI